MTIRKATAADLAGVERLYDAAHSAEEAGRIVTGWIRGIYPVRATAEAALARGDLFVLEEDGRILGTALINQIQVDRYAGAPWEHPAPDEKVCVLHTLVIDPAQAGRGYGTAFVAYYEDYALAHGWPELRIDTNERNLAARALYRKLGYREISTVSTVFNGLPDIRLVMLEKYLG